MFSAKVALPVGARVAAAALSYAVLGLLARRATTAAAPEIAVCLLQLPLLLRLVSFLAREVSGRTAARCSALAAGQQQQQDEQRQSSYNLSYMSVAGCCCAALLFLPIWVFLLQPPPQIQEQEQAPGLFARAYPFAVASFAVAGLVEAAGEVLYLRCLLLGSPWVRGTAEAAGTLVRSLLLASALFVQQEMAEPVKSATNWILLSPVLAFAAAQLGSSLVYLMLLWLQCHRLVVVTREASRAAKPAAAGFPTARSPRFLAAWPPFHCLSAPFPAIVLSGATCAAPDSPPARTGHLLSTLKRYISEGHLQLLPTNVLLTLQKVVLEYGEQLLLVMLLDAPDAAEYALVSGAASIVCRVFFAPIEASAFEAFCAWGAKPPPYGTASAKAAPAAFPREATLERGEKVKAPIVGELLHQGSSTSHRGLHRRLWASHHSQERRTQRQQQQDHREPELSEYQASFQKQQRAGSGLQAESREEKGSRWMGCSVTSRCPAKLLRFLCHPGFEQADVGLSGRPPVLLLLQSFLLLHGTLGIAAAAGGFLFGPAALRCAFGPTAVAPGAGYVKTLRAYCLYICALSMFGLVDAYAAATCNITSLRLLQRSYAGVSAVHLVVFLPMFVRFFSVWGQAAAAGAAVAQTASAVCRIFCCCACLSTNISFIQLQENKKRAEFVAGGAVITSADDRNDRSSSCGRSCDRCRWPSALREPATNQVEHEQARSASVASTYAVLKAIQPPGLTNLLLRFACCFVVAAAAQAALRALAFEAGADTMTSLSAQGYNAQQLRFWGTGVPLWWGELFLGFGVCVAGGVCAGPLLLSQVRKTYSAAVAAAGSHAQMAVHLNCEGSAPQCSCCTNTTAHGPGSF